MATTLLNCLPVASSGVGSGSVSSSSRSLAAALTGQRFPVAQIPGSLNLCRKPGRQRHVLTCRSSIGGAPGGTGALTPELKEALDKYLSSNKVVLFMKGTKMFPQCGFSNTVVQILNSLNVPYETVNILEDEGLRSGLKIYSSWPTFPQLYIDGEFFGGCDIALEAYNNGELHEKIEKAMCS